MSNLTNNTTDLQAILDEVSSYKEILDEQDSIIAQIAAALEGKTVPSGGASVETCTVTLTDNLWATRVIYTKFVDGAITSCNIIGGGTTYTDVVCGTTVFVLDEGGDLIPTTVSGNATILDTYALDTIGNVYLVNGDCTINMERYME